VSRWYRTLDSAAWKHVTTHIATHWAASQSDRDSAAWEAEELRGQNLVLEQGLNAAQVSIPSIVFMSTLDFQASMLTQFDPYIQIANGAYAS